MGKKGNLEQIKQATFFYVILLLRWVIRVENVLQGENSMKLLFQGVAIAHH